MNLNNEGNQGNSTNKNNGGIYSFRTNKNNNQGLAEGEDNTEKF